MEGTMRINCKTASGESADIRAISTPAIDEDMLISFKDLETLQRIPIGFPNTVVKQCNCHEKARTVATATIPLEEEFKDIISDELNPKPMNCSPMKIELIAGATPSKNMYTKRVPLPFEKEAEKVLQDLIDKGVITRVYKPSIWCHPAFFLPKPDGKRVRLVTDYTGINRFVKRPVHPFPAVRDILQAIPTNAKIFAKLDAVHGYFQLALDEESSHLTTFLLPQGRFRYTRAPMGLNASSDEWCAKSDAMIEGCPWAQRTHQDFRLPNE